MPIGNKIRRSFWILLLTIVTCYATKGYAKDSITTVALERVFKYKSTVTESAEGLTMNVYQRFHLLTEKKNLLLFTVPTMYVLAHMSNNEYVGESYMKLLFNDIRHYDATVQVSVSTVPRRKNTMPTMRPFMTPMLYGVTITGDHLLSPFHPSNKNIYRYGATMLTDNRVEIVFRPKKYNTQLISGRAVVDYESGRIITIDFQGEYDMVNFKVHAEMGSEGILSMIPQKTDLVGVFKYLGNKISCRFHTEYDQNAGLPDSIVDSNDRALLDSIRPIPLPSSLDSIYHAVDSLDSVRTHTENTTKKKNVIKTVLWDAIGDNLVNRIRGHFGSKDQGYFRLSPILNPLYMGYSDSKGIYYKMKLKMRYDFTPNSMIQLNARMGYLFKYHELYFNVPIRYTYNEKKNGYVELQIGNGNRINSSSVRKELMEQYPTLTDWEANDNRLDYFYDMFVKIRAGQSITKKWNVTTGVTFHNRSAVDKKFFHSIGMPDNYHTFAPMIQTQLFPWEDKGPVFTISYEQGLKVGKANMEYGRVEFDASWLRKLQRMRALSMRFGNGYYFLKKDKAYFLDYENFKADNMPGGWIDDWTGDFQLLSRANYNSSRYYVRANITYESPLMLMSRLPIVGKIIEMERVYVSGLMVDQLHPYMEWGYGFTNRLFSFGAFVATRNNKYDGIGFRFGLELFSDW